MLSQTALGIDLYVLGIHDHSDAEFQQSDYTLDFFPDSQPVGMFPKELNLTWYPTQYLHFTLSQAVANQGITFHLDPAWNDGQGSLRVAVDVWTGNDWLEAGNTLLNMVTSGYIDIPHGFLKRGLNDVRLRAVTGLSGTTVVTWDQIIIQTRPFVHLWMLGDNDESDREFAQSGFALDFTVGRDPISRFPKELNTTWWPTQYIHFNLSAPQCQKAAVLSFDVFWNDGEDSLTVEVERWDGRGWTTMGTVAISRTAPGELIIPPHHLKEGQNDWRLVAIDEGGGTTVLVWDSIALSQRETLPIGVGRLLEEILDTSLNFFLNPRAVPVSGLPLTALKVSDRARFGYSNPTEWGYALEAWVIAAERGLINPDQARDKITTALNTMRMLQNNPSQFAYGLFYPYYIVVNPDGTDVPIPYHSNNLELPSGDCALLWTSLNVVEGWLRDKNYLGTAQLASNVKSRINLRATYFTQAGRPYISMSINAQTQQLNPYTWLNWADEGGVVNMVSHLSNSTSFLEFQNILNTQQRPTRSWNGHTTKESAYFNAMFTWAQRSISGFPILGNRQERDYGMYSFVPNVAAHLDYGDWLGIDYPAFSDAMTQTHKGAALVGRYTPPNIPETVISTPPVHVMPHALAVPFCALDAFDETVLRRLFELLLLLRNDTAGIWHPMGSQDPFGFEVVASPYLNVSDYPGADNGRYIFETLNNAYTAFSMYEGLQRYRTGSRRTFNHFARQVPGYADKVAQMLNYAYQ